MNCATLVSLLDDHAIDTLSAAEKSAVDAHLDRCARCADAWLAHQALAAESPSAPQPGLLAAVLRRAMHRAPEERLRPAPRWAAATGFAAIIVLAAIALLAVLPPRGAAPRALVELAAAPSASRFMAGVHYEPITGADPAVAAAAPDVIDFFIYGCFPCYSFEPALAAWTAELPRDVSFERVPALFNALAQLHAQAFYTAAALGKLDVLHDAMFEEIHRNGNPLDSEPEIAALFARHGVDADTFGRTFDSPAVHLQMRRAAELNRALRVRATPALVVAGTYVTTPAMTESFPRMLDVASELLAQHRDRCVATAACDHARR